MFQQEHVPRGGSILSRMVQQLDCGGFELSKHVERFNSRREFLLFFNEFIPSTTTHWSSTNTFLKTTTVDIIEWTQLFHISIDNSRKIHTTKCFATRVVFTMKGNLKNFYETTSCKF